MGEAVYSFALGNDEYPHTICNGFQYPGVITLHGPGSNRQGLWAPIHMPKDGTNGRKHVFVVMF